MNKPIPALAILALLPILALLALAVACGAPAATAPRPTLVPQVSPLPQGDRLATREALRAAGAASATAMARRPVPTPTLTTEPVATPTYTPYPTATPISPCWEAYGCLLGVSSAELRDLYQSHGNIWTLVEVELYGNGTEGHRAAYHDGNIYVSWSAAKDGQVFRVCVISGLGIAFIPPITTQVIGNLFDALQIPRATEVTFAGFPVWYEELIVGEWEAARTHYPNQQISTDVYIGDVYIESSLVYSLNVPVGTVCFSPKSMQR